MIELPEAVHLAQQLSNALAGKRVARVVAGASPHTFAWFYGEPCEFDALARERRFGPADAIAGFVQIELEGLAIIVHEGVGLRYHAPGERVPPKHQLLVELSDGSTLTASVKMYGGIGIVDPRCCDNRYYLLARDLPSPLGDDFTEDYFSERAEPRLTLKAFLATEQRFPGLGNGVLQDILYDAALHPKRRLSSLTDEEMIRLYRSVRTVLRAMRDQGGRDTEIDLYGDPGGYVTRMSRRALGSPCVRCGASIHRSTYLGGTVYYCPGCQHV